MKLRELLWLLPTLVLYLVVVVAFASDGLIGDEGRYLNFATNLTQGFYTTREDPSLWNGPGYPLVLAPFTAAGAPLIVMKLLNAVFLFVAVCMMYATARRYTGRTASLVFAWLFAVYPPFLRYLPFMLTEALGVMLVACTVYFLVRWYGTHAIGWLIAGGVAFAYLAITKVFFGWVLMIGAALFLLLSLAKPLRPLRRAGLVLLLGFVLCVPYLAYTYWLTGKPLLWGTSGGLSLYFMSTPHADEYGNWYSRHDVLSRPELARHKPFFEELSELSEVERDARYRQEALKNIRRSPKKYVVNWGLNVFRMLFSYPFSHTLHKPSTLFYLVPNVFLVALMVFLVYPTIVGRGCIPPEVFALLLLTGLVLGGSSLLCAEVRFFAITVPMLAVWILVTLVRVVRLRLVREAENESAGAEAA